MPLIIPPVLYDRRFEPSRRRSWIGLHPKPSKVSQCMILRLSCANTLLIKVSLLCTSESTPTHTHCASRFLLAGCCRRNFLWAEAMLRSRVHLITINDANNQPQEAMCLIPAADLLNMAPSQHQVRGHASVLNCEIF